MPPDPEASRQTDSQPIAKGTQPQHADTEDTEPLPTVDSFGTFGWGSSWGAGWTATPAGADHPGTTADAPRRERVERPERSRPVMGDLELPAAPEPFEFPASKPSPSSGVRARLAVLGIGLLAILGVAGGLIFWLTNRTSPGAEGDEATPPPATTSIKTTQLKTTTSASNRDADAEARLLRLLPAGYAPGVCKPVEPVPGVAAAVECGNNTDPGGPTSAKFTLLADKAALDAALADAIRPESVVICPGKIQSPGPWRRNATPQQVSGTLVCGVQRETPTIAWSDEERMLVSVVRSDPPGPALDQLYQWWSTHS
jgi:serine/threonine kinase PknH